jgi:HAD superfamily hydrolase (TIGR01662 family)
MSAVASRTPSFDVVVPTLGRSSLTATLNALFSAEGPMPRQVIVVDDRPHPGPPLPLGAHAGDVVVLPSGGRGPAHARNVGWRRSRAEWVAFLDDDVVPSATWRRDLACDLTNLGDTVAAVQGRLTVPLPRGRRPTDWERNVRGLEDARWITADMAYRRAALLSVRGFDERFRRAFREDADLAARVRRTGWSMVNGARRATHPVRPATPWISVRLQAGNADDALLRAVHGRRWRDVTGVPPGRRPRHLAITTTAAIAAAGAVSGRRRLALAGGLAWLAGTGELAWARIAPGPRTGREIWTMLATSAVLPAAASYHWLRGWLTLPSRLRARRAVPAAVLFERDGTLVDDGADNDDPERVAVVAGARAALDRLRRAGVRVAIVSSQSGPGGGRLRPDHDERVVRGIERLVGPLDGWYVCRHDAGDACTCRRPAPGLILHAASELGVEPTDTVVVGHIGADLEAAAAAGARAVLVPTAATSPDDAMAAESLAPTLATAVDLVLERRA